MMKFGVLGISMMMGKMEEATKHRVASRRDTREVRSLPINLISFPLSRKFPLAYILAG
jgi:hypothetical protein